MGNVDLVWAVFMAFRDHRVFEMLELLHPEVIWVRSDGREYQGHDGIRHMLAEVQGETGGFTVQLTEVCDADERGVVLAKARLMPREDQHGIRVIWQVRFLGGLVKRVEATLPS